MGCASNPLEFCGGQLAISIYYPTGKVTSDVRWQYAGCFPSFTGALPVTLTTSTRTVEACLAACLAQNYQYCGLTYGGDCHGGNIISPSSLSSPQSLSLCTYQCDSNESEYCGGQASYDLYTLLAPIAPPTKAINNNRWTYYGCMSSQIDQTASQILPIFLIADNRTVDGCLSACAASNLTICGVKDFGSCFGGNTIAALATLVDGSNCNLNCTDNHAESCGGLASLDIYLTTGTYTPPVPAITVSTDATCGLASGFTCTGSGFGACCSPYNTCGDRIDACSPNNGCQAAFGECSKQISPNSRCGGTTGYTCEGSDFGDCCSTSGICGSTAAFCAADKCDEEHGSCYPSQISRDGGCGPIAKTTCLGSIFGQCCDAQGGCGDGDFYCQPGTNSTNGCLSGYGKCNLVTSRDGHCGSISGETCLNSPFGSCCATTGYCGSSAAHCSPSTCDSGFGTCFTVSSTLSSTTGSSSSFKSTTSSLTSTSTSVSLSSSTTKLSTSASSKTSTPASSSVRTTTTAANSSASPSAGAKTGAACSNDASCSSAYCLLAKCADSTTSGPKVAVPGHCHIDYNCGSAALCSGNGQPNSSDSLICVKTNTTITATKCTVAANCPAGPYGSGCRNGACYPFKNAYDPCVVAGDCASGNCLSSSLTCAPVLVGLNAACSGDAACQSAYCVNGKCADSSTSGPKAAVPGHCHTDYNCGSAALCFGNGSPNSSDTFACVRTNTVTTATKCTSAANCPSGAGCRSGFCYPLKQSYDPCLIASDCASGSCPSPALVCAPGSAVGNIADPIPLTPTSTMKPTSFSISSSSLATSPTLKPVLTTTYSLVRSSSTSTLVLVSSASPSAKGDLASRKSAAAASLSSSLSASRASIALGSSSKPTTSSGTSKSSPTSSLKATTKASSSTKDSTKAPSSTTLTKASSSSSSTKSSSWSTPPAKTTVTSTSTRSSSSASKTSSSSVKSTTSTKPTTTTFSSSSKTTTRSSSTTSTTTTPSLSFATAKSSPTAITSLPSGVTEISTNKYTAGYCSEVNGAGSVPAMFNDPSKGLTCSCYIPGTSVTGYTGCSGGASAACIATDTINGGTTTSNSICTSCSNTIDCARYTAFDLEYASACGAGTTLFSVQNSYCDCSNAANLAKLGLKTTDYVSCVAPVNGFATCSAAEVSRGSGTDTKTASCSFKCNTGFTVSADGTSCVAGSRKRSGHRGG